MSEFDTVLFDLGGVLVSDPWESLLLTAGRGLADRLGLDRLLVERVGKDLWKHHSIRASREGDYWHDLSEAIGTDIPPRVVRKLEAELLVADAHAETILDAIREAGIIIGVISDATSFWYPKQVSLANLDRYLEQGLEFVSFRFGVGKNTAGRGLFEIAAESVQPRRTLVVDDRRRNLDRASTLGFNGFEYLLGSNASVVRRLLRRVMA